MLFALVMYEMEVADIIAGILEVASLSDEMKQKLQGDFSVVYVSIKLKGTLHSKLTLYF